MSGERIRPARTRAPRQDEKVSLRQTPRQLVSKVVDDFNLTKWLAQESAVEKLVMAGYRGHAPYVPSCLPARWHDRDAGGLRSLVFVISHLEKSMPVKIGICSAAPMAACRRRCCS